MGNEENKNLSNLDNLTEKGHEISIGNLFNGDNVFVFIYKKTQKILSALYLITNQLPDEEPIKWNLRKGGGKVLGDIIVFFDTKKEMDLHSVKSGILETISLIEIGEVSGLIGAMNSMIIKAEFTTVLNTVSDDLQNRFVIPSNFFEVGEVPRDVNKYSKGEASGFESLKGQRMSFKTGEKYKGQKDIRLRDRKSEIISILRKKKEVNIKDVKDIISDCSEKTIQRDLLSLVAEGVLKKVGERRWSRYQIIG